MDFLAAFSELWTKVTRSGMTDEERAAFEALEKRVEALEAARIDGDASIGSVTR